MTTTLGILMSFPPSTEHLNNNEYF